MTSLSELNLIGKLLGAKVTNIWKNSSFFELMKQKRISLELFRYLVERNVLPAPYSYLYLVSAIKADQFDLVRYICQQWHFPDFLNFPDLIEIMAFALNKLPVLQYLISQVPSEQLANTLEELLTAAKRSCKYDAITYLERLLTDTPRSPAH